MGKADVNVNIWLSEKKRSIDTDYFISLLLWFRTVGWTC